MLSSLRALPTLLFPQSCLGCGRLGSNLCPNCNTQIRIPSLSINKMGVTVFAGFRFSPLASKLVLAAKEDNSVAAREILAQALSRALEFAIRKLSIPMDSNAISLIPIPSRNSANRSRGYLHTLLLAKAVVRESGRSGICVVNCLEHSRRVKDQSKLNIDQRVRNMSRSIVVKENVNYQKLRSGQVLLLDDLVTTGSTAKAAQSALAERGIHVLGAVASCAS